MVPWPSGQVCKCRMIGARAVVAYNTWGYIMSEQTKKQETRKITTDDAKALRLVLNRFLVLQEIPSNWQFVETHKEGETTWVISETFMTSFEDLIADAKKALKSIKEQGKVKGKQLARVVLAKCPKDTKRNGKPFGMCFIVIKQHLTSPRFDGFRQNKKGNWVPVIHAPSNWKGEVDLSVGNGYYVSVYVGSMKK